MRIFAASDLHTDFKENREIIAQIPENLYQDDTLIVAGDIADRIERVRETLLLLRPKFKKVFYLPGNHELWVRNEDCNSIEKLFRILDLCDSLNVETRPARVDSVWIVPLFSWYSPSFDLSPDNSRLEGWSDFYFCKWPEEIGEVSEYFSRMNEPSIRSYDGPVISFSHFLPRIELLPSREWLRFKGLPKVAGCQSIESQIRELKSIIHVFGHSHINRDCVIDGVRYVQNALSYPRERRSTVSPIKLIWEEE
jgi:Icc-related predicted phosphoesterase